MNRAGYVVLHDAFMEAPTSWSESPEIEDIHITHVVSGIIIAFLTDHLHCCVLFSPFL